jgi:tRNA (guanine-N7-)-methyltransferase
MSENDQHEPERGFFGRRKGHPLRARQAELFETLLPRLALDLGAPPPGKLAALFPGPVDEVRLEIGFGGAEHLIAQALAHPRTGFVGAEGFINGIAKALVAIDEQQLLNVRLFHGDAINLLDWLPAASIARVDLLYPDPWPKRRQRKRRFVSDEALGSLARVMRPGAEFRFATDIDDYAGWVLARVLRSPDLAWAARRAVDWRKPFDGWPGTRYEAKAKREGRVPSYLTFIRR